ncbi:Rieske (2Fe-2S) protein [Halostagnicola bangensis]
MTSNEYTKITTVDEVEPERGMRFEVDGIEIALFEVDGEYHAITNRCPHQNAPLDKVGEKKINGKQCWNERRGGFTDQPAVTCPWHLWEISLETGEHETSGKRVSVFDVKVDGDDILVRI